MAKPRRVNVRSDRRIFKRTANKVHKLNLSGYSNRRGGTCL